MIDISGLWLVLDTLELVPFLFEKIADNTIKKIKHTHLKIGKDVNAAFDRALKESQVERQISENEILAYKRDLEKTIAHSFIPYDEMDIKEKKIISKFFEVLARDYHETFTYVDSIRKDNEIRELCFLQKMLIRNVQTIETELISLRGLRGDVLKCDKKKMPPSNTDYIQANKLFNEGKYNEVIRICNKSLSEDKQDVDCLLLMGKSYLSLNNPDKAIEYLNTALNKSPSEIDLYSTRARSHWVKKEYESAINDYRFAIQLLKQNITTAKGGSPQEKGMVSLISLLYGYIGNIQSTTFRYRGAMASYNNAIKYNPNNVTAYCGIASIKVAEGKFMDAIKKYNEVLKNESIDNKPFVFIHWGIGLIYNLLGQYENEAEEYQLVLSKDQNYVPFLIKTAIAYEKCHEYDKAITVLTKSINIINDQSNASTKMLIQQALNQLVFVPNDSNDIFHTNDIEKVVEKYFDLSFIYYCRGNNYLHLNQYNKAIQDYNDSISINSSYSEAYCNRGTAYDCMQLYDKAIDDYNKALELNPSDALAKQNLYNSQNKKNGIDVTKIMIDNLLMELEVSLKKGKQETKSKIIHHKGGIVESDSLIMLCPGSGEPTNAETYYNRSCFYCIIQQYELAKSEIEAALEIEPQNVTYLGHYSSVYCFLKEYDRALEIINLAIAINKNSSNLSYRALLYEEKHQYTNAIRDIEEALTITKERSVQDKLIERLIEMKKKVLSKNA